jgi:phage tail protein X
MFIYFRVENRTITAIAMLVSGPPIDETPCFHVGWAVPTAYRNYGRAKGAITAAIAELRHGLARSGVTAFYVEAIVGTDNPASQRVAAQTMSPTPTPVTDSVSGLPALQYLLSVSPSSP